MPSQKSINLLHCCVFAHNQTEQTFLTMPAQVVFSFLQINTASAIDLTVKNDLRILMQLEHY